MQTNNIQISKRLVGLLLINIITILISAGIIFSLLKDKNEAKVLHQALYITQKKNYAELNKKQILIIIERYTLRNPAPVGCAWAMRKSEDGYPGYGCGMKRVFADIKTNIQIKSMIRVIQQEMTSYCILNRKQFVKHMAKRYVPNFNKEEKEIWINNVYGIWNEYEKGKVKK